MAARDNKTGRFISTANKWEIKDGIIYCFRNNELLFFTDDERVLEHTWCKLADGYSATQIDGKEIAAHRFISRPESNELVDHINRNKKDNTIQNLRNTNKSINAFNSKKRINNTSGRTGVYFRKDTKRWTAEIIKNGKKIRLGCYKEYEEAVKARVVAEGVFYGDKQ